MTDIEPPDSPAILALKDFMVKAQAYKEKMELSH